MSAIHAYVVNLYHDGSNARAIEDGEESMVGPYHDMESAEMAAHAMKIGGGNPLVLAALCECTDDERAAR